MSRNDEEPTRRQIRAAILETLARAEIASDLVERSTLPPSYANPVDDMLEAAQRAYDTFPGEFERTEESDA